MSDSSDRQQSASPRRRQQARQAGQVALSREFVFALVYAACGALLASCGPIWWRGMHERLRVDIQAAGRPLPDPLAHVQEHLVQLGWWLLPWTLVVCLAVIVGHWVQHGPLWLPDRLRWDLGRVDPAAGLSRIVSPACLANFVLGLIKSTLLIALAVWLLREPWREWRAMSSAEPAQLAAQMSTSLLRFAAGLGMGLLIWGGVDFAWRLYLHERKLWMTPEDQREEVRAVHNDVTAARRHNSKRGGK
jgi:flagellar biosynthetic protein FlhB